MTFLFSNLNFLEVLQKFLKVQQLGECYNGPPLSHTWIKALACTHFAFSTVTLSPFLVAKHAAWSLKWMAFKTVERFLTLSRLATKQYCSSSSGTRWVRRGMDGPPNRRFGERDAALPNFRKPERRTTDLASVLMGLATSIRNRLSRESAPLLATARSWTFGKILYLKTTVSSPSREKEAIHRAAVTGAGSTE